MSNEVIGQTVQNAPRLLDQLRAKVRALHYSRKTEESYVNWIKRYILFHGKRHPREMGAARLAGLSKPVSPHVLELQIIQEGRRGK